MSVQDYEIEYMEKIGSSSPVSIWCFSEISMMFAAYLIYSTMFYMCMCDFCHEKQSKITIHT